MPIDYPAGQAWPPTDYECTRSLELYREYAAWYSSDPEQLWQYYSNAPTAGLPYPYIRPSQRKAGLAGFLARFFWGRPLTPGQSTSHSHVPAAADLSALSRSLLWAEPPAFLVPDQDNRRALPDGSLQNQNPAQEWLEDCLDQGGWYATLSEASEIASAYGSAYVRAQANVGYTDMPTGDVITPDHAIPTWGPGASLLAVTFWRHVDGPADSAQTAGPVLRHLERYEMTAPAADGSARARSVVYHALYQGTVDKLGRRVPLAEGDDECCRLAALVGPDGSILINTTKLPVVHWPNLRPHRVITGTPLGRSDYQGLTSKFDELDEVWSSLMRDFRLAKARLVVPSGYLRSLGPGRGATFDPEQEIFTQVNVEGPDKPLQLSAEQFAIRTDDHLRSAEGLWRVITRGAGLSADAFGDEASDGPAQTATQVTAKTGRTASTRGDKITYATPPLRQLSFVLLELGALYYGSTVRPSPVTLEWPDAAMPDPLKIAQTLQALEAAKAISTRQKVVMLHPDWSTEDIDEEVALIQEESAPTPLEDPGTYDGGPGAPVDPNADPTQQGAQADGEAPAQDGGDGVNGGYTA